MMIGEYSFLGAGPQTPNTQPGIYAVSPTQTARATAFENFMAPLCQDAPWVVGDDWFEYVDEPQGGRPGDGENNNFGMVDVENQPYQPMADAMELLHSDSGQSRYSPSTASCDSWTNTGSGVTCTAYMPDPTEYPLSIVTGSLPNGVQGTSYSGAVYAAGGKPDANLTEAGYKFTVSQGSLPKGVKLQSSTGYLSGTPTVAGTSTFTVEATDSAGSQATQPFTLVMTPDKPVEITTTTLPTSHENTAFTKTLVAKDGTAPYAWLITSGALPSGLTLSSGGTISGQPTESGTFTFTSQVTDATAPAGTASANYTLTVKA
jgi:hypothetical protein